MARKLPARPRCSRSTSPYPSSWSAAAALRRTLGPTRRPPPRHRLRTPRGARPGDVRRRLGRGRDGPARLGVLAQGAWSSTSAPFSRRPGAQGGASVVGLDFDATVAWPVYDWMGVAKAALESLTRYLARDLGPKGIRVNLVAAGPVRTMAAKSIPGFSTFEDTWKQPGPPRLGRDRLRAGGQGVRGAVLGLVPDDDRRAPPRRRRSPRHGRLRGPGTAFRRPATQPLVGRRRHSSQRRRKVPDVDQACSSAIASDQGLSLGVPTLELNPTGLLDRSQVLLVVGGEQPDGPGHPFLVVGRVHGEGEQLPAEGPVADRDRPA